MRHIIFGGDGFVGRYLAPKLLADGHEVIVADIVKSDLAHYRNARFIHADVTDIEAVRKVASENFQARIAEGCDGTACVFVCSCEDHEGQAVTIDLAEHRYQLECCHADTCFPDYWGGHHLAHVQVPVWNGMSLAELKKALMAELNEGAVAGGDAPHDSCGASVERHTKRDLSVRERMTQREGGEEPIRCARPGRSGCG